MYTITIERIYDYLKDDKADGTAFLVDCLWPRGISKEKASDIEWWKEVGPGNELRKWFGHDPARFEEFKEKYLEELDESPQAEDFLQKVADELKTGSVKLLYGAKDKEHNNAVVLSGWLKEQVIRLSLDRWYYSCEVSQDQSCGCMPSDFIKISYYIHFTRRLHTVYNKEADAQIFL
ncbi:MAG: DUF488 family protein [Lachnospiraceae bacterium]|nr:DUF488 family protein [Lachnospiraceae bacterium]MEE3460491.1 DUF488 family protein [Lachnospiraceae bacterium]